MARTIDASGWVDEEKLWQARERDVASLTQFLLVELGASRREARDLVEVIFQDMDSDPGAHSRKLIVQRLIAAYAAAILVTIGPLAVIVSVAVGVWLAVRALT